MSAAAVAGLWVCLGLSAAMHLTVFIAFALMGGGGTVAGEDGVGGGGGDTVEITVAGPEIAEQPTPGIAPTPPPVPPEPEREEVAAQEPTPERVEPPRPTVAERRVHHADPVRIPAEPAEPEEPSEPTPPTPPAAPEVAASGTGDDEDSSGQLEGPDGARDLILGSAGLLPGDNGLRAILPDPTQCPDPIEGTWRAHKYNPLHGDWAHFTLHVQRDGDRLSGRIDTRLWQGGAFDREPPPCQLGSHDYSVTMQASGRVTRGNRVTFSARNYRVVRAHCPSPFFDYNPDRFSGVIDPLTEEFRSVNNDGGRDIDAPYTFHRVSCEP